MFDFGRELRRFFLGRGVAGGFQDGLTGGDGALLELLDVDMLRAEARWADVAAGRISAKDRAGRQLAASAVWREIARRTGDAVALRKAAALAEEAATACERETRPGRWAAARCEQALAGLAGAELFGDEGMNAAADFVLTEVQAAGDGGLAGLTADLGRAVVQARAAAGEGDREAALRAAACFDAPIRSLEGLVRRGLAPARLLAAGARVDRADLLTACGARLKDPLLLRMALDGLGRACDQLDPAYEPVTWARTAVVHSRARAALGEMDGDIAEISEAINGLAAVLEQVGRGHSPLDWVQAQLALAGALQMLGEAGDATRAFDQALSCFDRALLVLAETPLMPLRASVAHQRIGCLVRRAEVTFDLDMLDEAEASLRVELMLADAVKDPVGWAVRQLSFAEIGEARAAIRGRSAEANAVIGVALSAALDVFAERGLRSLADVAARGLERLRARAAQT